MNTNTTPEFIFQLTNSSTPPEIRDNEANSIAPVHGANLLEAIPVGWVSEPEAVSQFAQYQWARIRLNSTDSFGSPFLWSKFDGDCMKVGDTVRLKSGGPNMTVINIFSDSTVECRWFTMTNYIDYTPVYSKEASCEDFSLDTLKLIKE